MCKNKTINIDLKILTNTGNTRTSMSELSHHTQTHSAFWPQPTQTVSNPQIWPETSVDMKPDRSSAASIYAVRGILVFPRGTWETAGSDMLNQTRCGLPRLQASRAPTTLCPANALLIRINVTSSVQTKLSLGKLSAAMFKVPLHMSGTSGHRGSGTNTSYQLPNPVNMTFMSVRV